MAERIYYFTNCGKPYATKEEAEMRKVKVVDGVEEANSFLSFNNLGQKTTSKVEVVKMDGGFVVKQTVTKQG